MLTGIPSLQTVSVQSADKENSISGSEQGEGFSEHLGSKFAGLSEKGKPSPIETIEPEIQFLLQDEIPGGTNNASAGGTETAVLEVEPMTAMPQFENLEPQKVFYELHFSQMVTSQEPGIKQLASIDDIFVPPSESGDRVAALKPTFQTDVGAGRLMPTSELGDELLATIAKIPTANQGPYTSEANIFKAPTQIVTMTNGLDRETKSAREKSVKQGAVIATNWQTPLAEKSMGGVQNIVPRSDVPVQPEISLPEQRNSSNSSNAVEADFEKTVRSIELKTPAASVQTDSAVQKLSVDANVPTMSQPSQTLVRAIHENSNWTRVLASSNVQFDQTQKVDGTVLQKLDINLNLTELGKLDVKLRLHQGELQVQIRTDSEQAYKMLSADQDTLANTIKGLGYKVDNITISGPRSDVGFQMNNNPQMQSQHHSADHQFQHEKKGQPAERESMPMRDAENDTPNPSTAREQSSADVDII